jgi:hypothetical protein
MVKKGKGGKYEMGIYPKNERLLVIPFQSYAFPPSSKLQILRGIGNGERKKGETDKQEVVMSVVGKYTMMMSISPFIDKHKMSRKSSMLSLTRKRSREMEYADVTMSTK